MKQHNSFFWEKFDPSEKRFEILLSFFTLDIQNNQDILQEMIAAINNNTQDYFPFTGNCYAVDLENNIITIECMIENIDDIIYKFNKTEFISACQLWSENI